MKPFRSIRWRLQFWHGWLLALVLGGFGFTAYQLERAALIHSIDDELHGRLSELATALRPSGPGGAARPRPAPPEPAGERPPPPNEPPPPEGLPPPNSGVPHGSLRVPPSEAARYEGGAGRQWYFVIWAHNGPAVTRSPGAPAGLRAPDHANPLVVARGAVREASLPLGPGDWILVGRDLAPELAGLHRSAWLLTAAGLAILALGWIGGGWIVTRSLSPIKGIGDTAAKIAGGDLSQRIPAADAESELGQLAGVLNSTFARLEAAFAQQARFTADAAHELRTPVTVILTHTQNALASDCAVPPHREAFEACHRACSRMRHLIEALLQLARLDAGQEPIRRTPFDLSQVVDDCVDLIRPLATERRIEIRTELEATPCRGDPEQLRQVVTNLLANAIHHNVEGGEIRVSVRGASGRPVLVVSDKGPGIAPEHLPHLFERFYRVDQARTSGAGRTGLGLAIVQAIIQAHQGTIRVESEKGRGTTFTVELPAG